jgi:hypothetical protein
MDDSLQYYWDLISSPGVPRNIKLCPVRALRQNAKLWLMPQLKSCGFNPFFISYKFRDHVVHDYDVIIWGPSI